MYTRRPANTTLTSLRRQIKVCRRVSAHFSCSVEILNFVTSFKTATETTDAFFNDFDGDISENQSSYINRNRNYQFYGRYSGGTDQNQNPSRIYGQIGTNGTGPSNTLRGASGMNLSGYNYASSNTPLYGRILNDLLGQNFTGQLGNSSVQQNVSSNGNGNGGMVNKKPQNKGEASLETSRVGSYGGKEDMPLNDVGNAGVRTQYVAGRNYSNARMQQRVFNEFQSGVGMEHPANVGSVGNGGMVDMMPQNRGEARLETSRDGSYGGKEDKPLNDVGNAGVPTQYVAGRNYSNARMPQRVFNESLSGFGMEHPVNVGSVGNGGMVSTTPQNRGEARLETSRVSSYGGKEDKPLNDVGNAGVRKQYVAGRNYSNARMPQRVFSESLSGFGMEHPVNMGSVSNGGMVSTMPQNRGEARLETSRVSSYGGKEDMPLNDVGNAGVHTQYVAGRNYSNAGMQQRVFIESQSGISMENPVFNESQSGIVMEHPVNVGSVGVVQDSQSTSKLEDLDQFMSEGKLKEAVELLGLLEKESIKIDLPRYMALMKACGEKEAFSEAKSVHKHLVKSIIPLEVRTYNQILEMYSKCGSMEDAFTVFDQMPARNLTSWDIMTSWLAKNGHGEDSLELFSEFKQSGLTPDGRMFLGVFSACGVVCDIVEGMLHFESMMKDYGIVPSMEHYVSIVDMLGNAGCLDEALEFIQKMPVEPSTQIWDTLMKFCRIHGNHELGDRCAELIELLDPLYLHEQSRAGLIPVNASDLEKEKERKKSGQGPLDVRHKVHEYRAGDRTTPDNERLYDLLRALKQLLKEAGYVPELKCVLHDVDHESKEEALMAHSERLAAAHGFLTSPARSSIRIIKNLRVCSDCHNVFKIISKIVGREIVARDSKRFDHFRDGSRSCGDFW